VAPDDGVLIYDVNLDGIGQHDEFVLTTFVTDARTDFEALKAFDSNGDGVFNASDAEFSKMKIGRDVNQNGVFEAGEVRTLGEHGIVAINLSAGLTEVSTPENPLEATRGVYTFNTGQFIRSNGSVGGWADTALESIAYSQSVYTDGSVSITSFGTAHAWIQNSAAPVSISLATASYAGYGHFVEFYGNAGNDVAYGDGHDNLLSGGDGADSLFGEGGDDTIVADFGDIAWGAAQGGAGYDWLIYTSPESLSLDAFARSFEAVSAGSGNDLIYASGGTLGVDGVLFLGNDGADDLRGHDGNDVLIGGAGADRYEGGNGDDVFIIDAADSWTSIFGGWNLQQAGDIVMVTGSTSYHFGNLFQQHVENFYGGSGNDTAFAGRTDGSWYTQGGSNRLSGGKGNDYIYGGTGDDIYFWDRGDGYDTYADRDYGATKGDMLSLGESILAQNVTLSLSGSDIIVSVAGAGAGQITLTGFAPTYGPVDMLFVENKFYDLNYFKASYMGPVLVSSLFPIPPSGTGGSTGGGGGGGGTGWGGGGGGGKIPPLVLDLDGDGFELISAKKSGIYFDWDGDGVKDETGWVAPDDALLVMDRDGDGAITRADEIAFGNIGGKKEAFVSDLEGLRAYDSNGNGSFDAADEAFHLFAIWRDADLDATVDPGEMIGLAEAGLLALSLSGHIGGPKASRNDNIIYATTDAAFADGSAIKVADVFLHYDGSERPGQEQSSLVDWLAAAESSSAGAELHPVPHIA
jgi:hypothetical protein